MTRPASFDPQAAEFDARAGLPEDVAEQAAAVVLELGGLFSDALLLEVGAGTGQLGQRLLPRASTSDDVARDHRYLGFDLSSGMLDAFRSRAPQAQLVVADACERWPVDDHTVRLVFGARVFHLLRPRHVSDELLRVAHPRGATLMAGRVRRDRDSPHKWLRRGLHQRLKDRGLRPRGGQRRMMEALEDVGCQIANEPVATWTTAWVPGAQLEAWASKPGLAGLEVPDALKTEVLADLRQAATAHFGDLDHAVPCEHRYVLECARTPGFED